MARVTIERAEIGLFGVVTPPGLRLASLALVASGLEPGTAQLNADGPVPFRAVLTAEDLTAFLRRKGVGGLQEPEVTFEPGVLVFRARKRLLISVTIEARGAVVVRDGRFLDLRLLSASALGAKVTGMAERVVGDLNPLFDIEELPVPARLLAAEIGTDLVLTGEAIPPFSFGESPKPLPPPDPVPS